MINRKLFESYKTFDTNYKKEDFTYGVELEYSDVYRFNKLPEGCMWNEKDYTIVNSNGIANDPLGVVYKYGGEINTKPTKTVEDQIELIKEINSLLDPKPVVNYKSNLHIHIGVPGLFNDVESCKCIIQYINYHGKEAFKLTDEIVKPSVSDFKTNEEYKGALKRYRRNLVSHQYTLPRERVDEILSTKTMNDFYNAHAPIDKKGRRSFHISPRPGINLRQLKETKTIEFRHFFGTLDLFEIKSCLLWCREFVYLSLTTDEPPRKILDFYELRFPKAIKYDHYLQKTFEKTNLQHNTREEVEKVIRGLL